MAKQITDQPALTSADTGDLLLIRDISAGVDKKTTVAGLAAGIGPNIPSGTLTNAMLSTTSGDLGGAWTAWTPTVSAGSGAFTSASAAGRYIQIGKTVIYSVDITVTTIGTGTGANFTLPVTARSTSGAIGSAREDATSGNMGVVKLNSSATVAGVLRYDNGNITSGGNGSVVRCNGAYEAA